MPFHRVVVIGASAGGLRPLRQLVSRLGRNFPVPVLVVLHMGAEQKSMLPGILTRAGDVPVSEAAHCEPLSANRIYTPRPDHHLLLTRDTVFPSSGPKENGHRPSIDVLFRAAALAFGAGTIGVVLSGALDDGASGAYAIKRVGGRVYVQDPSEAEYVDMPLNAQARVAVDGVLSAFALGAELNRLVLEPPGAEPADAEDYRKQLKVEVDISASDSAFDLGLMEYGQPTRFTCPSCHGVLFRIDEGTVTRYRCHTGHGFSFASLLQEHGVHLEDQLWQAIMSLQESIALLNEAAERIVAAGDADGAVRFLDRAREAKARVDELRRLTISYGKDDMPPGAP